MRNESRNCVSQIIGPSNECAHSRGGGDAENGVEGSSPRRVKRAGSARSSIRSMELLPGSATETAAVKVLDNDAMPSLWSRLGKRDSQLSTAELLCQLAIPYGERLQF